MLIYMIYKSVKFIPLSKIHDNILDQVNNRFLACTLLKSMIGIDKFFA